MSAPRYQQQEAFRNRSRKRDAIRQLGIDPYPAQFTAPDRAAALHDHYRQQEVGNHHQAQQQRTPLATLAGRLIALRAMGKNAFAHLQDDSGKIQLLFNRQQTRVHHLPPPLTALQFIEKHLDLGDLIGVSGHLFRTQRGELTLSVEMLTLLCKTLLPLPDKHSGLKNRATQQRKPWLNFVAHPERWQRFALRCQILTQLRKFFLQRQFLEVETPILQNIYGGARARPFTTQMQALQQRMFLRISLEIPLKKLLIGGVQRVFEIGKVFRNEGIDRLHNPEFSELEAYVAYADYYAMMDLVEDLFATLAKQLWGTTKRRLQSHQQTIDLTPPWPRLTMQESLLRYADIDVSQHSDQQLLQILVQKTGLQQPAAARGLLIAHLFEQLVQPQLIQPHHIIDHPLETTPLCKLHRNPQMRAAGIVERFESFILGQEFCNSYSELNDPQLQRQLLLQQAQQRAAGDAEAHPLDEEFLEALCHGMPPAAGVGIGVDRLVMLLTDCRSIREVLLFPLLRREEQQDG